MTVIISRILPWIEEDVPATYVVVNGTMKEFMMVGETYDN